MVARLSVYAGPVGMCCNFHPIFDIYLLTARKLRRNYDFVFDDDQEFVRRGHIKCGQILAWESRWARAKGIGQMIKSENLISQSPTMLGKCTNEVTQIKFNWRLDDQRNQTPLIRVPVSQEMQRKWKNRMKVIRVPCIWCFYRFWNLRVPVGGETKRICQDHK